MQIGKATICLRAHGDVMGEEAGYVMSGLDKLTADGTSFVIMWPTPRRESALQKVLSMNSAVDVMYARLTGCAAGLVPGVSVDMLTEVKDA
jgi:hypothetical protein